MGPDNTQSVKPKLKALPKSFEPQEFESELYRFWEESGCFEAHDTNAPHQDSFCIVIPPPNVTGVLHMGHALTNTIQDILSRWRRMCGDNTLWLPGTDHAGIATQAQVEGALKKEGKSRHDIGREKFLERTWEWKEHHHERISTQLRRLGSSLDWSRERFTMDEGFSNAVREVFVRLYEEGLIYRGERIINWCTRCQTALSDLEVVPQDRKAHFWHISYPVVEKDGKETGDRLVVATTRPETMLGDTAVAIHPEDERHEKVRGKFVKLPLMDRILPIIEDDYVDREFRTGALKVTPAHDFNDYDIGLRHKLEIVSVIGKDGKITSEGGVYAGTPIKEARKKVAEDLESKGYLVETEDYRHSVGLCQRCDSVAEPVVSKQWFVKIKPLADPAIEAVETGKIQFSPKNWEKTYFEWMYNIRDWCISRQLWWGHQIPAWHCHDCEEVMVARVAPSACSKCQSKKLTQSEDVLDTWFSSGLWPFGTLGWPEKTKALGTFYPNSILETGFDIIFFWVARMIMMGMHFMGDVPFRKVYLHAMVRDEKGEKMSKSKGNVIDPLEVADQQGADPLRFTFAIMAGQGRDIKLSNDRVTGYRAFCNKLWNATKFSLLQLDGVSEPVGDLGEWLKQNHKSLLGTNRWILSRLQSVTPKVDQGLSNFELNIASQAIYDFIWHEFCDWYLELSKIPFKEGGEQKEQTAYTLYYVLEEVLKLAHPFIPYVTERLWQELPWKKPANTPGREAKKLPPVQTLMLQEFPLVQEAFIDRGAEDEVGAVQSLVDAIRNFRGENSISPKKSFEVVYRTSDSSVEKFIKAHDQLILTLSGVSELKYVKDAKPSKSDSIIPIAKPQVDLIISLKGLVDAEGETKRLNKEIARLNGDLEHVRKKLSNKKFVEKAPKELVGEQKNKEKEILAKLEDIKKALERLGHV